MTSRGMCVPTKWYHDLQGYVCAYIVVPCKPVVSHFAGGVQILSNLDLIIILSGEYAVIQMCSKIVTQKQTLYLTPTVKDYFSVPVKNPIPFFLNEDGSTYQPHYQHPPAYHNECATMPSLPSSPSPLKPSCSCSVFLVHLRCARIHRMLLESWRLFGEEFVC